MIFSKSVMLYLLPTRLSVRLVRSVSLFHLLSRAEQPEFCRSVDSHEDSGRRGRGGGGAPVDAGCARHLHRVSLVAPFFDREQRRQTDGAAAETAAGALPSLPSSGDTESTGHPPHRALVSSERAVRGSAVAHVWLQCADSDAALRLPIVPATRLPPASPQPIPPVAMSLIRAVRAASRSALMQRRTATPFIRQSTGERGQQQAEGIAAPSASTAAV